MSGAVQAIARLYQQPGAEAWRQADAVVDRAIAVTSQHLEQARGSCQSALAHLHLLRSALRDDESAMAPYIQSSAEPNHAS